MQVHASILRPVLVLLPLVLCVGCGPSGPGGTTLSYWNKLLECSTLKAGSTGDQRSQAVANLRLQADSIERLPTAGVDLEATRVGLTAARMLRQQAAIAEQGGSLPVAAFIDGFFWGLTGEGDPLASAVSYDNSVNVWGSQYQAFCDEAQRVRVSLTSRYGVEFPNLIRANSAGGSLPGQDAIKPTWWSQRSWFQKLFFIGMAIYLIGKFFAQASKPATAPK